MKTAVLTHLEQLPPGSRLLHGDFHPDNILITATGPVIIDWIDAAQGDPLADVARTLIIISIGRPAEEDEARKEQIRQMRELFVSIYLARYGECRPFISADLETWKLPVAAGRLSENISEIESDLLAFVKAAIRPG